MGTRSTIKFFGEEKEIEKNYSIASIYQQYDGYLSGVGKNLISWLKDIHMVNGIDINGGMKVANGIGCLAAQYIAEHKKSAGGLYMTSENDTEEYNYEIYPIYRKDDEGRRFMDIEDLYIVVKTEDNTLIEKKLSDINLNDFDEEG